MLDMQSPNFIDAINMLITSSISRDVNFTLACTVHKMLLPALLCIGIQWCKIPSVLDAGPH